MVWRLLAVDHHLLHLLLLTGPGPVPCGPDWGRRVVNLTPGQPEFSTSMSRTGTRSCLLRQQSCAIKNQLVASKAPTRGFGTQNTPIGGILLAPRWFFMA